MTVKIGKNELLKFLIEYSGSEDNISAVKSLYKHQHGKEALQNALAKIPSSSIRGEDGITADEAVVFANPTSKKRQEYDTERAMSRGAKLRPRKKTGFDALGKAALEISRGNNKGGLAKKTKGFKQGGLAGTGHNDMRKGGLFK